MRMLKLELGDDSNHEVPPSPRPELSLNKMRKRKSVLS
jgi:hypothetical protein